MQNEPLELKVLDYDAISANDVVGCVYIDLNPLLAWDLNVLSNATASNSLVSPTMMMMGQHPSTGQPSGQPAAVVPQPLQPLASMEETLPNERQISGWFPLYDTLRGIRGEVNVQIKLQFFGDVNPFKDSSAGVQVFGTTALPPGYKVLEVFGFVEVLLNEDDPEYHWSDSFRTPRYSNESRQKVCVHGRLLTFLIALQLLYRLAGNARRRLGREALEMGGNAIIGFKQSFDLENKEYSITARATGTCVKLVPVVESSPLQSPLDRSLSQNSLTNNNNSNTNSSSNGGGAGGLSNSQTVDSSVEPSAAVEGSIDIPSTSRTNRRMVSSGALEDPLAFTTTASSLPQTSPSNQDDYSMTAKVVNNSFLPIGLMRNNSTIGSAMGVPFKSLNEQHLITLNKFPEGTIVHLGGIVSARSVKLLQNDETEVRDAWWTELREEIKSHARAVSCSVVIGYQESISIQDELCVLSAIGTAAQLDFRFFGGGQIPPLFRPMEDASLTLNHSSTGDSVKGMGKGLTPRDSSRSLDMVGSPVVTEDTTMTATSSNPVVPSKSYNKETSMLERLYRRQVKAKQRSACQACHIPYRRKKAPFPMSFVRCYCCKKKHVPEILITNVEPLPELETIGEGYYVEAHICRPKKRKEGESNATIVSDSLPFIEYDIHRQLLYKLRIQGLNAIFGLQIQLTIGESLIVAVASGTATYLSALPPPPSLRIARNLDIIDAEDRQLMEIQRRIMERSEENRRRIESARLTRERSDINIPMGAGAEMALRNTIIPEDSAEDPIIEETTEEEPATSRMEKQLSRLTDITDSIASTPRIPHSRSYRRAIVSTTAQTAEESDSDSSDSSDDGQVGDTAQVTNMVVQVDDDTDEDFMAVLLDPQYPEVFQMCNTESLPMQDGLGTPMARLNLLLTTKGNMVTLAPSLFNAQMITVVKEGRISTISHHPNRQLAAIFRELYEELQASFVYMKCCLISGKGEAIRWTN